jgi:hypothetical protein
MTKPREKESLYLTPLHQFPEGNRKVYSQRNQDIIIHNIFKQIGTTNKFCVEFGWNSDTLTGGSGPNTANLIVNEKWDSLLLDQNNENPAINLHRHSLTPDNICDIFQQHNVPTSPDYVSIDVDSIDLWLFKAILKKYKPRLVSVEYNAHFGVNEAITLPQGASYLGGRGYGASLKALKLVGDEFGYSLISVETPLDAFFVRNDLWDTKKVPPLNSWAPCCAEGGKSGHDPIPNKEDANLFLDYEVYLETNGDLKQSRKAALPIARHRVW